MVRRIVIEAETPGDSRTMFRLRIDASLIADDLTSVQAHILVGEIFERIAMPKPSEQTLSATESEALTQARADTPAPRRWPDWQKAARRVDAAASRASVKAARVLSLARVRVLVRKPHVIRGGKSGWWSATGPGSGQKNA
jgi:hypothetical protein